MGWVKGLGWVVVQVGLRKPDVQTHAHMLGADPIGDMSHMARDIVRVRVINTQKGGDARDAHHAAGGRGSARR